MSFSKFFSAFSDVIKRYLGDFDNWRTYVIWGVILLAILIPAFIIIWKNRRRILESKAGKKAIEFLKWMWAECKDWRTLILLIIVCLVLSSPVWVCYILAFVFSWEWAFIVATAVWAFWWLPGAPFFALAVSITLAIKKIWEKGKEKKEKNRRNDEE